MEQTEQYGDVKIKAGKQGILTFALPEDENAFKLAVNATEWALVTWDLDGWLRNQLKYGHKFKTADDALEAVREELRSKLGEYHLDLEMIE